MTNMKFYGYIIIGLIILSFTYNYYTYYKESNYNNIISKKNKKNVCKIPYMDPFDKSIISYVFKEKPLNCSKLPPLIISNDTHLIIEEKSFIFYNITSINSLNCSYQPFWRIEPMDDQTDHLIKYDSKSYFFNTSVLIETEFVRVKCYSESKEIYKDFHFFIPVSSKNTQINDSNDQLNVIIIGVDAVSRLNFHRTMPLTLNYLINELQAIEFLNYNKVADNTFPNLVALLTGSFENEIQKTCWNNKSVKFDDCNFVWKNFNKSNYVTAFCEDASWMGAFHYLKKGFKIQPTTHYWTTFSYTAENEIGHTQPGSAKLCVVTQPIYVLLLQYAMKLINSYKKINQKFFGFFWETSLTHDFLNYPSLGDESYRNFLQKIKESDILEKSILFVISDHGIRWGGIRSTHQGHMEERLPMLYISMPSLFRSKYPAAMKNMKDNAFKLTTPFDIYETLKCISENNFSSDNLQNITRGISLFRPVPENRSCITADIKEHWCTCQDDHTINSHDKIVKNVANFTIIYMNDFLKNYTKCAKIELLEIKYATLSTSYDFLKNNITTSYYTINFQTRPGNAEFESTVMCINCNITENYELSGSISRTNLYGNQSYCVENTKAKLYCYCIDK